MLYLHEAETIGRCIETARLGLAKAGVEGEILVADNGSTDGSAEIASRLGARVEFVKERGYGSALGGGMRSARGRSIIMGDADGSYDFAEIAGFVGLLRGGSELVMGCRFPKGGGTIRPGAMPWKNRRIGNPLISWLGRRLFRIKIHDFNCGLRGLSADACRKLDLKTTGMEFASEMVIKASFLSLKIAEVPITLSKAGRSRPPHLRPWRDGWRHLRFMLLYSPLWLFLAPGLAFFLSGLLGLAATLPGPLRLGRVILDVGTMIVSSMSVILGFQLVAQAFYAKVFAVGEGLLPGDPRFARLFKYWNLEKGIILGLALIAGGGIPVVGAAFEWIKADFGPLNPGVHLRKLILGATLLVLGLQSVFASFHLSVLGIRAEGRTPPEIPHDGA